MNSTVVRKPAQPARPRKNFGLMGVGFFIVTESMFFIGLFLAWFYLRATTQSWPPAGVHPPPIAPAIFNTLVVLMSAVAVWFGTRAIANSDGRGLVRGFALAAALGVIFMAVQIAEFADLALLARASAYGSTFTVLLFFHVLRVFIGVSLMVVVLVRALMNQFSAQRRLMVRATAMYWYFIVGVWLMVFAVLYLVK